MHDLKSKPTTLNFGLRMYDFGTMAFIGFFLPVACLIGQFTLKILFRICRENDKGTKQLFSHLGIEVNAREHARERLFYDNRMHFMYERLL